MAKKMNDSIMDAIKYTWKKMARVFWLWLILIPIFGWFPAYGYILSVIRSIVKGDDKALPAFGSYWTNFVEGFYYFLFMIILGIIIQIVIRIPLVGWIVYLYVILITPMLIANYAVKKKFAAFFDVGKATKMVFGHFGSYIVMILKSIVVTLFFLVCSIPIITMIWTLPAMQFGGQFLIAQFYRKFK